MALSTTASVVNGPVPANPEKRRQGVSWGVLAQRLQKAGKAKKVGVASAAIRASTGEYPKPSPPELLRDL